MSERASEQMSAAERAIGASSAEQANEWAKRVNKQTEEQMAQCSTRQFHSHSTQCASICSWRHLIINWPTLPLMIKVFISLASPTTNNIMIYLPVLALVRSGAYIKFVAFSSDWVGLRLSHQFLFCLPVIPFSRRPPAPTPNCGAKLFSSGKLTV